MIEVREYLDRNGRSPFNAWFQRLSAPAAAKVSIALVRIEHGNLSTVKGVGSGVLEYRIDFGRDGRALVILLAGGTKTRQRRDIETAQERWEDYRRRKRQET